MLSDLACRKAGPNEKDYKLTDRDGLYLLVKPSGTRLWRFDYRYGGKRKTLAIGVYPELGLPEARQALTAARKLLKAGTDPMEARRRAKLVADDAGTFGKVFEEWFSRMAPTWTPNHAKSIRVRFESDLLPHLGRVAMTEIDAPLLLGVLQKIEKRGALYTATRARENAGTLFRYAIRTGRCRHDPSQELRGAFVGHVERHRPAIVDPEGVGELLRAIWDYRGSFVVRQAFRLSVLVALRPGEVRKLEWSEICLEQREIRIPAEKMKMRSPHVVPLAKQAIEILRETHELTGRGQYVFPSARHPRGDRPMSEAALSAALNRLGFQDQQSAHGFRSVFCSLLNETGRFNPDAIERQLAHQERDSVRAAYLHTQFLPERRRMMAFWADYVDELRTGRRRRGEVVELRPGG